MNIVDPEALFNQLDKNQQTVARCLQLQAYALDHHARKAHAHGNARGCQTCTADADALRLRLEALLLSAWVADAATQKGAAPC